ncbi:MAG: 2-C-methyl-D-erythritol 4-phosphate cytidylyltransferase [Thermoleophilia bacterium]
MTAAPSPSPLAGAIVVAAGAGVRMGAGLPKALMPVAGRPLLAWSVEALARSGRVGPIVVTAPPDGVEAMTVALAAEGLAPRVVPGGATRSDSVREGLAALPPDAPVVLVHDAARPLLTAELVGAVLDGVSGADGAIAAEPLADTLKRAEGDVVVGTVAREGLWRAQTPQAFDAAVFRRAVEAAAAAGALGAFTDCAGIVEAAGGRVRVVASPGPNPKLTTPADVAPVEALLGSAGPAC